MVDELEGIPSEELEIRPGSRVEATDGHVGSVGELVVDQEAEQITHFVLQEGHRWGKKDVTLPVSAIDRMEGDAVFLKLDKKAIEKLPSIPRKRSRDEDGSEIELVARVFDNPAKANDALEYVEELSRRRLIKILNAAVLVKDDQGNVTVNDTKHITPKKGRILGAITGGLVGLLAGPAGAVIGALAGLGAGGPASKWIDRGFSDEFLNNLNQYLQPGSSALILLMEHHWVKPASEAMADWTGTVFQQTITDRLVEDLMSEAPRPQAGASKSGLAAWGWFLRFDDTECVAVSLRQSLPRPLSGRSSPPARRVHPTALASHLDTGER